MAFFRLSLLHSGGVLAAFFALVGVLLAVATPAVADGVDVSQESAFLVPYANIYEDDSHTLDAAAIMSGTISPSRTDSRVASFGFSEAANWFDVSLVNPGAETLERYLVFEPTWLDSIGVTLIKPDGTIETQSCGDFMAFSCRALEHRLINFRLDLPPGQSRILVRTKTSDPYVVGISLWEKAAFFKEQSGYFTYYGVLYGVLGALLFYNLIVYFMVREKVYAAYVVYLATFMIANFTYSGHSFPYLWPDAPVWGNWAHSVSIYLFAVVGLMFGMIFLNLRRKMPAAFLWAVGLMTAVLLSFVITAIVGGYGMHVLTSIVWVAVYAPFILVLGILSLIAGNYEARYFVFATAAGLIGSFVTSLTVLGGLPFTFLTFHAADMGMMVDAILLSIALADRLRLARRQSENIKTELLEISQSYAYRLECEVTERTEQLKQSNADKDRILAIIAHDLRGPIGSMSVMFNNTIKSASDITHETLSMMRVTITNIGELLEELLLWSQTHGKKADVKPSQASVAKVLRDTHMLLNAYAENLGVRLDLSFDGDCLVLADERMLRTIMRNFVNNAIKFTPKNGSVLAAVSREGDMCKISIHDTGVGMDEDRVKGLFVPDKIDSTLGARGESGTGLGLVLCREFVEMNGGAIGCESVLGQGSTFWVSLPLASFEDA